MFHNVELINKIIEFLINYGYKLSGVRKNGIEFVDGNGWNCLSIVEIGNFTYITSGIDDITLVIAEEFNLECDDMGGIEIYDIKNQKGLI